MELCEVEFEEFMDWMGRLEQDIDTCEHALRDAVEHVPLIQRLMIIQNNAVEQEAGQAMRVPGRDVINVLISLRQIESGRLPSSRGRSTELKQTRRRLREDH